MIPTSYSIRVSNLGDVANVTKLLEESYPTLMKSAYDPDTLGPALKLMTRANPALLSSGTYYVAESQEGALVGCGGWTRERPGEKVEAESIGHIRHFGTHSDWIRKGIGSAILRKCVRDARASGIRELECYSSLNAERFYGALGFERIAVFNIEMTSGVSLATCHMHLRV